MPPIRAPGLSSLDFDTLIEGVFLYLSLRDIFHLRMTCRHLYRATHDPSLWKRIMRELKVPIPPLPQSLRYAYDRLDSFETEKLVCRAITVDANWRSHWPRLWLGWKIPLFADILSIKMLPGGHYAVASVKRREKSFALQLLLLDRQTQKAYPIGEYLTGAQKPYAIQAKYMDFSGEQKITISYVRREPRHQKDRDACTDVSDFSDDAKFQYPVSVRYELVVLHCSLESLSVVDDPRYPPGTEEYHKAILEQPNLFTVVTTIRSRSPFEFLDLDYLVEWTHSAPGPECTAQLSPCIVWVQSNHVYFKNLVTKSVSSFICAPVPVDEFSIRAIRMLPPQGELLVVRTAGDRIALELFTIPAPGDDRVYTDVQISFHNLTFPNDKSISAKFFPLAEAAPIYVYALSDKPWGAATIRLWPQRVRQNMVRDWTNDLNVDAFTAVVEDELMDVDNPNSDAEDGIVRDDTPRSRRRLDGTTFRYTVQETVDSYILPNAFTYHFDVDGPNGPTHMPNQRLRVIPGCTHGLLYGTDMEDITLTPSLRMIHSFVDMQDPPPRGFRWPDDVRRAEAAAQEHSWLKDVIPPRSHQGAVAPLLVNCLDVQLTFKQGLTAIAWDDWAGRVCMVPAVSPSTLYLLDYAFVPRQDEHGHRIPVPVPEVDWAFRPAGSINAEQITKL